MGYIFGRPKVAPTKYIKNTGVIFITLPKRKQLRLKSYDYSQEGAYLITICTNGKNNILWNVGATFCRPQDKSHLSEYGLIIDKEM